MGEMESRKAEASYCSNCTRLVTQTNARSLRSILSPSPEITVQKMNSEVDKIFAGYSIAEAMSTVCGIDLEDTSYFTVVCSQCGDSVYRMFEAYRTLIHFNKHSHQVFQLLKSRTDQRLLIIKKRQAAERELAQSINNITDDDGDIEDILEKDNHNQVSSTESNLISLPFGKVLSKFTKKGNKRKSEEELRIIRIRNLAKSRKKGGFQKYLQNPLLAISSSTNNSGNLNKKKYRTEERLLKEAERFTKSMNTSNDETPKDSFLTHGLRKRTNVAQVPPVDNSEDSFMEHKTVPKTHKMKAKTNRRDSYEKPSINDVTKRISKKLIPEVTKELVIRIPRIDNGEMIDLSYTEVLVKEEPESEEVECDAEVEAEFEANYQDETIESNVYSYKDDMEPSESDNDDDVREDSEDDDYIGPSKLTLSWDEPIDETPPNRKKYWCPEEDCGRGFVIGEGLAKHIQIYHEKPRPFVCKFCDGIFSQLSHLREHMTVHKGEPGVPVCDVEGCNKAFKNMHSLKCHKLCVHDVKKFQCPNCPKAFSHKALLTKHETVLHPTGPLLRPHICDECGLGFVFREYLRNHEKTVHVTEPKFICSICGKGVKNSKLYKSHLKVHSDKKPYQCQYCGKTFRSSGECTVHQKSHTNLREYVCHCGKDFNRKTHLSNHLCSIHKLSREEANRVSSEPGSKREVVESEKGNKIPIQKRHVSTVTMVETSDGQPDVNTVTRVETSDVQPHTTNPQQLQQPTLTSMATYPQLHQNTGFLQSPFQFPPLHSQHNFATINNSNPYGF